MYRKYIINLEEWIKDPDRKPLLIYGARQIGKTYLIKDLFADKYFPNRYLYIDCKHDIIFANYMRTHVGPKEIIDHLEFRYKTKITKDVLLIFDEAQACLPIITAMKYFCQDAREIPVIVTGSMVRIKIQREANKPGPSDHEDILFPLGKIDTFNMYQLDFGEYLFNANKKLFYAITDAYKQAKPLESSVHELALDYLHEYLLIGGMPEATNKFLLTHDIVSTNRALKNVYNNYLNDMSSYQTSSESIVRTRSIYHKIYKQLNKEQKNFRCNIIGEDLRHRDLRGPIDWLLLTNIIYKSQQLKEKVTTPLIAPLDSLFRLYFSDMGLFTHQSGIDQSTFIDRDMRNTLSGIFFENYVAMELKCHDIELFYWKGKNRCELEFLVNHYDKLIPIDVKKTRGTMDSLKEFQHHNPMLFAIKISTNNWGYDKEQKLLTLPLYMMFLLAEDLANKTLPKID